MSCIAVPWTVVVIGNGRSSGGIGDVGICSAAGAGGIAGAVRWCSGSGRVRRLGSRWRLVVVGRLQSVDGSQCGVGSAFDGLVDVLDLVEVRLDRCLSRGDVGEGRFDTGDTVVQIIEGHCEVGAFRERRRRVVSVRHGSFQGSDALEYVVWHTGSGPGIGLEPTGEG